ncbi:MAG: DNA-formamidopyrimidine glycosylase [Lentisphaerae bacterium]|jgi:formamidopyrimidine-DNA glycosylase|nr:DNA-formamidopyrimidine glycosylase [Lentisphaerota bacterium]
MPELPEVETVVRDLLTAGISGTTVKTCEFPWPNTADGLTPAEFTSRLCGKTISNATRRGKYIVLQLAQGGILLIHLRMTGKLRLATSPADTLPHDRLRITFTDGRSLILNDTRKFARARLGTSIDESLGHLGPEPLEPSFTAATLGKSLVHRKRAIKTLLLDQTIIAGIGNIYADESLFDAGIHPERLPATLSNAEIKKLHAAIRRALKKGIAANGTTLGNASTNFYSVAGRRGSNDTNLMVFRRNGLPCPKCDTTIERSVVGGRGTHHCPHCQPRHVNTPG